MFTRKHYVEIAKVLCESHKTQPECDDTIFYITANLANMFKKDNPRFDLDKFERASRCAVAKAGRKSKSGLRLFGSGEAYRPASGATIITSEDFYGPRRRR